MQQLTDFTTYDEVRASLGTNPDELADVTLALPLYARGLVADLEDIAALLPTDYATVLAINEGTRTAKEQALVDAVQLFAPYSVAAQLSSSLPLFSPKQVTDGKAGFSRYADSPYKTSIDNAKKMFDRFRARLVVKYADYKSASSTAIVRPYGGGVSPTSDPVTG
jgi:hypothetical protein